MIDPLLAPYRYTWPSQELSPQSGWFQNNGAGRLTKRMPEPREVLRRDSRWPAFFPCPISLVTTSDGRVSALEKVVGASIVNRFPYVIALSFCRQGLSDRHHVRGTFMSTLERGGIAAVQFLRPGPPLDRVLDTIASVPEHESAGRIAATALPTRPATRNACPVFDDAYMVYEATLVAPGRRSDGGPTGCQPWVDVGSHRVYFLEITAIQLDAGIAAGRSQIHWRSLPSWTPNTDHGVSTPSPNGAGRTGRYQKAYTPDYRFPAAGTVAFEADEEIAGMAVKYLPPCAADQVEIDNDRARWPCFFPSSAGLITSWAEGGLPDMMPCGSTTVVSRHPLVIAPCVSYSAINERYAPRASLRFIRRENRFGCGVPYLSDAIIQAIRYAGNVSFADDPDKVAHAGLAIEPGDSAPVLSSVPIHFDCEVIDEIRLGTHAMFLGEVRTIRVQNHVRRSNPLEWCPWASVRSGAQAAVGPVAERQ